ncbi:hypothetical protein MRX96_027398 [Rhipicephalus microplus]
MSEQISVTSVIGESEHPEEVSRTALRLPLKTQGQPALLRGALVACAGAEPDGGGANGADSDMGPGSVDLSDLRRRYSGRLRHSLLLRLLAALVVLGLAFLLLVLLMYPHAKRKREAPKCRTALSPVVSAEAAVEVPSEPSSPAKDWYRSKAEESAQEVLQLKKKVKTLQQSKRRLSKRCDASENLIKELKERKLLSEKGLEYFAQDLRRFVVLSVALLAALAVLVLLALVPAETLLKRLALTLGLLGWLLLAGPTLAWTVAKEHISLVDPLAPAFVAAFLLHVLLPLKQLAALLMGPVTSAGLLATTVLLADWDTRHFGYQVAAASLFLAMATAVGWYHRHMRDAAQSRSFASTQECIEARIKLEYEKEQQNQSLKVSKVGAETDAVEPAQPKCFRGHEMFADCMEVFLSLLLVVPSFLHASISTAVRQPSRRSAHDR